MDSIGRFVLCKRLTRLSAGACVLAAGLSLTGTEPAVAVCLALLGAALFKAERRGSSLTDRRLSLAASAVVAFVGAFTMSRSPGTGTCLVLSAAAVAALNQRTRFGKWAPPALMIAPAGLSLFALLATAYGAASSALPFGAALIFPVLAVGVLCSRPDGAIMSVLISDGPGGLVARRLLPAALLIPAILGGVRMVAQRAGWFPDALGFSLLVAALIVMLVALLAWTARELDRSASTRDRATARLRASEERLTNVMRSAPDAIIIADGIGRIVLWNASAAALFGWKESEIVDKPLSTIMPERYREAHQRGIDHVLAGGESMMTGRPLELHGLRRDGTEFPIELSLSTWRMEEGRFHCGIVRDLTSRRHAEEERRQLDEQLTRGQKLAAIGQMAAGIAHEINNPISYVLSNSATLRDYFDKLERMIRESGAALDAAAAGRDPAQLREELGRLRQELEIDFVLKDAPSALTESREGTVRVREIVGKLREFSHPDDRMREAVDLNGVVESALRMCANELKFKAEVRRELGEVPPVVCQPQRIEQVLINLLLNAAQSIRGRGTIKVRTGSSDGCAWIQVLDSGSGISSEHLPRLFEPFFTTKPVGQGTGLGLYVAYKIVRAHGGEIKATSEPGRGTEFTVHLPIAKTASHSAK